MAPNQLIKNKRGQSLTETFFLLITTGAFLYLLLRSLLALIFTVAIDSMTEDYFFCELAERPGCASRLEIRLKEIQVRDVKIQVQHQAQKTVLTISGMHVTSIKVKREFDYEKFKQKF